MASTLPTQAFGPLQSIAFNSAAIVLLLISAYFIQNEIYRWTQRIKNLPGPWGWPVVGNMFQVSIPRPKIRPE